MFNFLRLAISGTIPLLLFLLIPIAYLAQTAEGGTIQAAQAAPPFSGTISIDPDIITSSDPTLLQNLSYAGQGIRVMFDRRVDDFITVNAYLFNASFADGLTTEIQVNPEFGSSAAALIEAQKYGEVIGRLPTALRADVETVWIHKGTEPFGGGNNNLLIHTDQADIYAFDGILEETFVHEAAHTSLDATHAAAPGWLAAQSADDTFISTYARDNPDREDIAESFLPYLAVRYRSDRISQSLADTILQTIPNRIAYFDNQSFDLYPIGLNMSASIAPMPNPIQSQTELITYTILLRNNENVTATQLMISNTVPAATNYVNGSASHGGGIAFPGQAVISGTLVLGTRVLSWPKTSLSPGATLVRSFQVAVTTPLTSGDRLVNTLSVASAEGVWIEGLEVTAIVDPKQTYLPVVLR